MLSASPARASPRGIALVQRTHRAQLGASPYTRLPALRFQTRRYYGRILRSIVSKHVSTISDAIRPIVPLALSDQLSQKITASKTSAAEEYTASSPSTVENLVELEDDVASEIHDDALAESPLQDRVRHLMRRVPHPVAVITSTDPNAPEKTAFRGMTVSSFNTVTLYPDPVVSFNVKVPSETYNAILSSTRFLVHLLAPNERTARLAREFSKGHENVTPDDRRTFFRFTSPSTRLGSPAIQKGEPPRLVMQEEKDASSPPDPNFPFIFECRYLPQSCRVGDHVIVLGTVVKVFESDGTSSEALNDELCLTYANVGFWRMGQAVAPRSEP